MKINMSIDSLLEQIRHAHRNLPLHDNLCVHIELTSSENMIMLTQYVGKIKFRSLVRYFDSPDFFNVELKGILIDYLKLLQPNNSLNL